ncbi:class I SAM-dependent methyltransferase [bacterium]|nr:class I SAM-dependent methyltransferase [bacterium]
MAFFNQIALVYDDWYKDKKGSFIDWIETDLALGMLDIKAGMRVLDVGCGTGNFSIKLAKMGCEVTGIDISEDMLTIAKEKTSALQLPICFQNMDTRSLQFSEKTFDMAISMAAFEFVKEPFQAIDEIFRVVKTGSQVLIGTINRDSDWGRFYLSKKTDPNSVFYDADLKTLDELKKWKPNHLVKTGECLFISPFAPDDDFNIENETRLRGKTNGGYICASWKT